MTGVQSLTEAEDFSSSLCIQTGSGANPASCPVGTGGSFPGGKARPRRDADHSPPSSAEVKYEYELYLLSRHAPPWPVVGQLYFYFLLGLGIGLSQGLYLHRTLHRKTFTCVHALSGIQTHDSSVWLAKTHASACTTSVIGHNIQGVIKNTWDKIFYGETTLSIKVKTM
jgi:hypothetical protein